MTTPIYQGRSLRLVAAADRIVELVFDREGDAINKLDSKTIDELREAVEALRAAKDLAGILVTSAKNVFIVGADIFEFTTLFARPQDQIEAHVRRQNEVFTAFEDLPVPIVTAIGGLALGGGLEMALASDARVMADTTQIGLPEVSLGLFPGFGGTVRLPRLAGAAVAVDWVSTGKPRNASSALAAGVVDKVVPPEALRAAALDELKALMASGDWRTRRERRRGPFVADSAVFENARRALEKTSAHQPAARAAVELMERTAALARDAALSHESAAFAAIARTQAAASLVQIFINDQAVKKKSKSYAKTAREIRSAAVLGAGIMGGGIAYTSAARGIPVVMKDIAQRALDLGVAEARKLIGKQVESGRMRAEDGEKVLASIRPSLDYSGFEAVDLVVEAVVENMEVKKSALAEVERQVGAETVIASNTSSLSLSEMSSVLSRPQNFVGLHFFNPVHVMPLVEVIQCPRTSDQAAAAVVSYAVAMGKTPIVVKECPGFLVNRILTPYMLAFLRALCDGADYLDVDRVMERFGWPMGPAYLQDVIGMDTLAHVLRAISEGYPERMRIDFPNVVERMVERKRLGQKSGAGFYRYENDPKGRPRKAIDLGTQEILAQVRSNGAREIGDRELFDRLMLPMILEAARCLEEGIAASAAEVDMSLVLGIGFPRYAGGPLKLADWLGIGELVKRCDALAGLGPLYVPPPGLRAMAAAGGTFY